MTINRPVLEFCITQLREIHAKELVFDMANWGSLDISHPFTEPEPDCGFAGCFVGWAAHQQWFDQFGVKVRLRGNMPTTLNDEGLDRGTGLIPLYGLLGVEGRTVDRVVLPEHYREINNIRPVTAEDVANRLQELLDMGEEKFLAKYDDDDDDEDDDYFEDDEEDEDEDEETAGDEPKEEDKDEPK